MRRLTYAGIGSRQTPAAIQAQMRRVAMRLCSLGLVLRSGGAQGADAAFESGVPASDAKQIFLPWGGFNGNASPRHGVCEPALNLAASLHPAWHRLTPAAQKLMARNCYQILGKTLDDPVAFVLCWTPDGCESEDTRSQSTGGTGRAIALATRHGIPVFNLANPDALSRLRRRLEALGIVERQVSDDSQTHRASGLHRYLAAQHPAHAA